MTVLALQVAAGADDGLYGTNGPSYSNALGALGVGNNVGFGNQDSFHARFEGVSGLGGATINAAVFSGFGFATGSGSPLTKVRAEAAADPATISDAADWESRTLTAAGVDWDEAATDDAWNDSPDISAVIEEIQSLDPSVIQIYNLDDGTVTAGHGNYYEEYDTDSELAPKLTIDYTAASTGGLIARSAARATARPAARTLTNRD